MVNLIGLRRGAMCLFFLASFVTVDAHTEEKGLFMGRKCLACGCQLLTFIPVLFVTLAARSLVRPDTGHAAPCQDRQPPVLIHMREEQSHFSIDSLSCSVESRAAQVGHDNVPRTLSKVSYVALITIPFFVSGISAAGLLAHVSEVPGLGWLVLLAFFD